MVRIKWRDLRKHLGRLTETRTTVYAGGLERALSLDQRGIYAELKRIADSIQNVKWSGHAHTDEAGRVHMILLLGASDQLFLDRLQKSNGFCRVVHFERGHDVFKKRMPLDGDSAVPLERAELAEMKGSFMLEVLPEGTTIQPAKKG